jgi:hypothetical protein
VAGGESTKACYLLLSRTNSALLRASSAFSNRRAEVISAKGMVVRVRHSCDETSPGVETGFLFDVPERYTPNRAWCATLGPCFQEFFTRVLVGQRHFSS